MQSMAAVEFAVPFVATGATVESKSAETTLDSEAMLEGLDPELAALSGMWAAIFQQQISPQAEAPSGKTLEHSGEIDTAALDVAGSDSKPQIEASGNKETGKTNAQALSGLLASISSSFQSVSQPQTAKQSQPIAEAQNATLPQSSVSNSGFTTTPAPAEVPNPNPEHPLKEEPPPAHLSQTRLPEHTAEVRAESIVPEAPTQKFIPDHEPAKKAIAVSPEQASTPAPVPALPVRNETNTVPVIRQVPTRKALSPGTLRPVAPESGLEPHEVDPKLTTEVSLRKKLSDPVRFELSQAVAAPIEINPAPQAVEIAATGLPAEEPTNTQKADSVPPPEFIPIDSPLAVPEEQTFSKALVPEQAVNPIPEPATKEAPASAIPQTQPIPAEPKRVELPIRQEIQAKAAQPTAPARRTEFEAPTPMPAPQREAKTISIRIPLTDSSRAAGAPVRHLDLVFSHKNNDLNLQFLSPNTEIQRNIEESMPALMDRLRPENWTAAGPDAKLAAQAAEPMLESRRRVESFVPAGSTLESFRETIASPQASSQGFNFDDAPQQRKGDQQQQSQTRNPKRDETWRDELDQLLET